MTADFVNTLLTEGRWTRFILNEFTKLSNPERNVPFEISGTPLRSTLNGL